MIADGNTDRSAREVDDDDLFEVALGMARAEAARSDDGEGVAAAARTVGGRRLSGVWVDAMVDSACLCAETGPIAEAHRGHDPITMTICVRWTEADGATVLPACGVCQERLAVFGTDVLVAIARSGDVTRYATLAELRPSPWWDVVDDVVENPRD